MGEPLIALGMYTVYRELMADLAGTIRQVAAMGYGGVEFYGSLDLSPAVIRRALEDSRLSLVGWHVEWRLLQPDMIDSTVSYLEAVGCPRAIVPCLGGRWQVGHGPDRECRAVWEGYAKAMNGIAARLARYGIALGYHNHEHEFQLRYDGKAVFDILFGRLDPSVILELDTGNAIEGGADPAEVLARHNNRPVLLHCKPWSVKNGFHVALGTGEDANDWPAILAAGGQASACIVESESAAMRGLDNAKQCIEGLRLYLPNEW